MVSLVVPEDNIVLTHTWPKTTIVHHNYTLTVTLTWDEFQDDQETLGEEDDDADMSGTSFPTNHQEGAYYKREIERFKQFFNSLILKPLT